MSKPDDNESTDFDAGMTTDERRRRQRRSSSLRVPSDVVPRVGSGVIPLPLSSTNEVPSSSAIRVPTAPLIPAGSSPAMYSNTADASGPVLGDHDVMLDDDGHDSARMVRDTSISDVLGSSGEMPSWAQIPVAPEGAPTIPMAGVSSAALGVPPSEPGVTYGTAGDSYPSSAKTMQMSTVDLESLGLLSPGDSGTMQRVSSPAIRVPTPLPVPSQSSSAGIVAPSAAATMVDFPPEPSVEINFDSEPAMKMPVPGAPYASTAGDARPVPRQTKPPAWNPPFAVAGQRETIPPPQAVNSSPNLVVSGSMVIRVDDVNELPSSQAAIPVPVAAPPTSNQDFGEGEISISQKWALSEPTAAPVAPPTPVADEAQEFLPATGGKSRLGMASESIPLIDADLAEDSKEMAAVEQPEGTDFEVDVDDAEEMPAPIAPAPSASNPGLIPPPPPAMAKGRPPAPKKAAQVRAAVAPMTVPTPVDTGKRSKRGKPWFEEIFDEDYLRTLPFLTPQATQTEAQFVIDALGVAPGAQLLDVGCGYGRHAMEMAARGLHIVGLDLSLPLLLRGADEAQRRGLSINFIHGDMREIDFESQFDGAYCLFSTFGYFDDDTNKKTIGNIARALKPGGRVIFEVLNRDYIIADLPTRVWWEGDGCVVLEEVEFNYFSSRIQSNRSVVFDDGRQVEQEISVRAYSLHELGKLLHTVGFRVLEVSGSVHTRGRFFGNESRHIIVVAEKKIGGTTAVMETPTRAATSNS